MKRVGIFSGTFDPVHDGHLAFAAEAAKLYTLNKVFFLVEPRPRRKQGVRAFEHRQEMVQRAIKPVKNFGSIILEQERFTAHETMPILKARFKGAELCLLIGDDMLHHLGEWPHVEELLREVTFIIGLRRDSREATTQRLRAIEQARGLKLRYEIFQAPESACSSTTIRLNLKRGEMPIGVPAKVLEYITEQQLYTAH